MTALVVRNSPKPIEMPSELATEPIGSIQISEKWQARSYKSATYFCGLSCDCLDNLLCMLPFSLLRVLDRFC
jgi:hypothetical protein